MCWSTARSSPRLWASLAIIATTLCVISTPGRAQTYSNPLVTPAFPPPGPSSSGPADPCVLEFEGSYHIYPTGNGASYKAMISDDLVDWTGDYVAFEIAAGSPWKTGSLWAPEVKYFDGLFYLYYTAGAGDITNQHIGVAVSDSPLGPFVDQSYDAPLVPEPAIDAFCFRDDNELYLYYAALQAPGQPFLSIWVRRMWDPMTLDADSPAQLCLSPTGGWEGGVNEGPSVVKRGSQYYMFYSAYGADWPDYAVGVAVADDPLGPWSRQGAPYNPVFEQNDSIGLWGPGHGHNVVGPDGVSDWYVYHHKINANQNFKRHLALDRVIPVARDESWRLHVTSSGGTTEPTPRPRRASAFSNFEDGSLPTSFSPLAGNWVVEQGKLWTSLSAELLIARALSPPNRRDFRFEWWLRAGANFVVQPGSLTEFSFDVSRAGEAYRAGFRIRADLDMVEFIEYPDGESPAVLASASLIPAINWLSHSRCVALSKSGSCWQLLIDREPVLALAYEADVDWKAYVRTELMPIVLDGYRQTVVFSDEFEQSACTAGRWTIVSGSWDFIAATGSDDGHFRQSDQSADKKIAVLDGLAFGEFDLSADFHLVSQDTGPGKYPKHGLIHNYIDEQNFAMVFIDDQYDVIATAALVGGVHRPWINSTVALPLSFFVSDYRSLAVTTDTTSGEFVYSLNGEEMLRRNYPGLPGTGQAGLITELSDVRIDSFRFSGVAITADPDDDGVVSDSDTCPYDYDPNQMDTDGDGVGDACDHCLETADGIPVDVLGCPPTVTGDHDWDSDVDGADFAALVDCLNGPNIEPAPADPELSALLCEQFFDFDWDLDVDLADFERFMVLYSGARIIDCNGNGIEDICDTHCDQFMPDGTPCTLAAECGQSADCNQNNLPDECEPDCNGNSMPDDCDILDGTSSDCQPNGVPDECDLAAGTSTDIDGNLVPDECQPPPCDCNEDGVLDAADLMVFAFCMSGPDVTFAPGNMCLCGDVEGDMDVDLGDFVVLQIGLAIWPGTP